MNKLGNIILLAKTLYNLLTMLVDSTDKIVGDSHVKNGIMLIRYYVHIVVFFLHLRHKQVNDLGEYFFEITCKLRPKGLTSLHSSE